MISSQQMIIDKRNFDPIDYFVKIIQLLILTWKFRWKRVMYIDKLTKEEKKILKLFGHFTGKKPVEIYDSKSNEAQQIIFYGWVTLNAFFWTQYFKLFIKSVKSLIFNKTYQYPPVHEIDPKSPYIIKEFPCVKKIRRPDKQWVKILNIENQFAESIRFLYYGREYFKDREFRFCKYKRSGKVFKQIQVPPFESSPDRVDYVEAMFHRIVRKKPYKPFEYNIWTTFFVAYISWVLFLVVILPYYIFPEVSVQTGAPILVEIISSQVPMIVFYIIVLLLFLRYQKLIDFTEKHYDEQSKLIGREIEPSFLMRADLRLTSHNTGGFMLAFFIGFLLYSIPFFIFVLIGECNWDISAGISYLFDIFFISDIFLLWAINFGMGAVAIYIIGAFAYSQYHLSKDFRFNFDRFHSPNVDNELTKHLRTICLYIFTSGFLMLSSGLVYFVTRSINFIVLLVAVIGISIVVVMLFFISLVGWKRSIHQQKIDTLKEVRNRRKDLIATLKAKEQVPGFIMHEFKDMGELKFLNDQYLEITSLKEWFLDITILLSFLVSIATFFPKVMEFLEAWLLIF